MKPPRKKKPDATNAGQAKTDYGGAYKFLRFVQRPFFAVGWRIEQACARIETKHELNNWNREKR